jgi:hypothetical protein
VPVTTPDGTMVYRIRMWDPVLKRQIERTAEGVDAAARLLADFNEAKRRPGRLQAERIRFAQVAAAICSPTGSNGTAPRGRSHHWPRNARAWTSTSSQRLATRGR